MKRLMQILLAALLLATSALTLAADTADNSTVHHPKVRLSTNFGDIVLELYPEKAPKTVANFLQYVNDGFYDGTIFHRVIDGFMIQGGGFTKEYVQKKTRAPIPNEADNGLHNTIGTIAMARTSDPQSATAQFFINVANNDPLDFREKTPRAWGYCVFGRVVEGMPIVKKIKEVPTGQGGPFFQDVPQTPVIINQARLVNDAPASPSPSPTQPPKQ